MIITFDGTSGSGKGTIASTIAQLLGFEYLDTGKLYRAFAYIVLTKELQEYYEDTADKIASQIEPELLKSEVLYSEHVAAIASKVAKSSKVRDSLIAMQREFVKKNHNVVLDGRDTGSVICPEANIKFYVDADINVRAERRLAQLFEKGINDKSLLEILSDLEQRDYNDKNRDVAPLVIPEGAIVIDNTHASVADTVKKILELIDIKQ
jgi:cytidylate kinase